MSVAIDERTIDESGKDRYDGEFETQRLADEYGRSDGVSDGLVEMCNLTCPNTCPITSIF